MLQSASIRAKLLIVVMVTTCASLVLTGLALGAFEFVSHRRTMTAEMAAVSEIIGANSTAALAFNDERAAREILLALKPQREIRMACLYDRHGRPFASFVRHGSPRTDCPPSPAPDGGGFEGGLFVQSGPVMLESERVGTLGLVASQHDLWARMQLFGLVLALTLATALGIGVLVSARLRQGISLPILELAETARRVSEKRDYALRAPRRGNDEIGAAVGAFNHMLDRIQDADSALRQAELHSREQAQFLGSILDTMGEGLIVIDQDGKILVWNPAARRITGSGPDTPLATWPEHFRVFRRSQAETDAAEQLPLVRALRGELAAEQELHLETKDGGGLWVNASARPLRSAQGVVVGAIMVFRDVTLQKQAERDLQASEAKLRQAQKMEAVGQLAGGIAHDFNNILTVICGYGAVALETLPSDAESRTYIEEVLNAAERAATLTRQLLAFSRRQVLTPQRLDLNAVVRASGQMLKRLIGEDVEFSVISAADLGVVLADPGKIDQVIINLVVNARDAMPEGGTLTIDTDNVEIDTQLVLQRGMHPGSYVRLRVKDTGLGISPEVQARIFEPFFTTKPVGRGTGLGLSTVYGILQQSGGHIEVSSSPGAGTTFSVFLPRILAEHAAPDANVSAALTQPLPRGSETILLVEDEVSVRNLALMILCGLGYKVLVAGDGQEALELQAAYDGPIHLLVSDVVMPRLGGGELARLLSERLPGLPVIFISGYTPDASLTPSLPGLGIVLLSKPFTADVLGRAVRTALNRQRLSSAIGETA